MGFTPLHGLAAKGMTGEIQKLVDNDWVAVSIALYKQESIVSENIAAKAM